jgi:cell division protein FtsN
MPKDYAKFVPPKSRRAEEKNVPVKLFAFIFVVLLAGVLGGVYLYAKNPAAGSAWLKDVNKPAPNKLTTAEEKPQVRFDFYEQLPNMQIPTDANEIASVPPPAAIMSPAKIAPMVISSPTNSFNPDEVTQLLEAEQTKPAVIKPLKTVSPPAAVAVAKAPALAADAEIPLPAERYVVQLGEFDSEPAAKALLQAINSVGFDAQVVKISRAGHKIYKVQQGPYLSMSLALQSQQRMQKRGLISTILKS